MKVLWFTWKDIEHPLAGGAEVVNHELAKRLVADGHEVIFLVGGFTENSQENTNHGYKVIRMPGGRFGVYWHAYRYYRKHMEGWADVVIDEMNTIPFFCKLYVKEQHLLFVHQLAREIWFYEMRFPFSLVGYLLEPLYLKLLSNQEVITISQSTKDDLQRYGFKADRIHTISEGIEFEPVISLDEIQKYHSPTLLSIGSIRSMKRTDHILQAFQIAKKSIPDLQLIVAGKASGSYGANVLKLLRNSSYTSSITYLGPVSKEKKIELLQKSHLVLVTSVKEGWCLVVTEANSQGTPAVVYDVDGLRDSVQSGGTGVISAPKPERLAVDIVDLLSDTDTYSRLQQNAWKWSKEITFERSYVEFLEILHHV